MEYIGKYQVSNSQPNKVTPNRGYVVIEMGDKDQNPNSQLVPLNGNNVDHLIINKDQWIQNNQYWNHYYSQYYREYIREYYIVYYRVLISQRNSQWSSLLFLNPSSFDQWRQLVSLNGNYKVIPLEEYIKIYWDKCFGKWFYDNYYSLFHNGHLFTLEEALKYPYFDVVPGRRVYRNRYDVSGNVFSYGSYSDFDQGICLIVVNEKRLTLQAFHLKLIFERLNYQVLVIECRAQQIKKWFQKLDAINRYLEAIVTIVISHGRDGVIDGIDKYNGYDVNDTIKIEELFRVFRYRRHRDTPIFNFFDSCRCIHQNPNVELNERGYSNNKVIYSCSKGQYSYYSSFLPGFTNFGVELCRFLAEYAFQKGFNGIFNLVRDNLRLLNASQTPQIRYEFELH